MAGHGKRYARVLACIYCASAAEAFMPAPTGVFFGSISTSATRMCPSLDSSSYQNSPSVASRSMLQGAVLGWHLPAFQRAHGAVTAMWMAAVDVSALEAQIAEQGDKVRRMKEAIKVDANAHTKAELTVEVDKLKTLKAQLSPPAAKPETPKPAAKAAAPKPSAKQAKQDVKVSPREERTVRIGKAEKFREKGVNPYAYTWDVTDSCTKLQETHKSLGNGQVADCASTSIAGRVMAKRIFGKLAFYTLTDSAGEIQLYLEEATVNGAGGDSSFEDLKNLVDVGDWIGVEGGIKRTDKGELSVLVRKWAMLTKTILPLPDKFKGLTDVNIRYRRRYVDLIMNSEVRDTFRKRAAIVQGVRSYLSDRGYIEIETPVMNGDIGGADARPFITHHNALDMKLFLRIATELHLKRMVVGGFERVFELGRIFRNEGVSTRHNPEFTSVELYQAYADYEDMIRITEVHHHTSIV
jgi:hypothetical protein